MVPWQTQYAVMTLSRRESFPRIVIPDHWPIPEGSTSGTKVSLEIMGTSAPKSNSKFPPAWKLFVGATGLIAGVGEPKGAFPIENWQCTKQCLKSD